MYVFFVCRSNMCMKTGPLKPTYSQSLQTTVQVLHFLCSFVVLAHYLLKLGKQLHQYLEVPILWFMQDATVVSKVSVCKMM